MYATSSLADQAKNDEERHRLAALHRGLVNDGRPSDRDADMLRRQIVSQGSDYDVHYRLEITEDSFKAPQCELCAKLQNDLRFLMVHQLNVLEQIKAPVREIAQAINTGHIVRDEEELATDEGGCCGLCMPTSLRLMHQ